MHWGRFFKIAAQTACAFVLGWFVIGAFSQS